MTKEPAQKTTDQILDNRQSLSKLREILFANIIMAGEIPSPTGLERAVTQFLSDRFSEGWLNDISRDQAGNVAAVLPGTDVKRNLLVAAHVDKIWGESEDHTVNVGVGRMSGRGIADNGLGVAVLATLPLVLEALKIQLKSNLILLGTTRSFGRGDLAGMRFFLEHTDREIGAALCLEGMNLGRLSYSCLGMARGVISVDSKGSFSSPDEHSSGAIACLNELVRELLELNRDEFPETKILIGSIEAGSGYNVPPGRAMVRFEIRSEDADLVERVETEVKSLVGQKEVGYVGEINVEMIAHRQPGNLGTDHPLVEEARNTLSCLGIRPNVEPSISELSALLDQKIPSLTLGITKGENRHAPDEMIHLEPIFDGLAQIVSVLQFMDASGFEFEG